MKYISVPNVFINWPVVYFSAKFHKDHIQPGAPNESLQILVIVCFLVSVKITRGAWELGP